MIVRLRDLLPAILSLAIGLALAGTASAATPNAALRKQLNTFFSNFSEVYLPSFAEGKLSDLALLEFALSHLNINAGDKLTPSADGNSAIAPANLIDKTTLRYFDRKIKDGRKATYRVELASGETYRFSQVDDVEDAGDGRTRVTGIVYAASSGAVLDPQADPTAWAADGEEAEVAAHFTAVIRKIAKRYVLVSYAENE